MKIELDWNDFKLKVSEYTGTEPDDLVEETNLYNDLGMDSLGLFSLGMFLIKSYGIQIPISAVARIETVHDMYTVMIEEGTVKEG